MTINLIFLEKGRGLRRSERRARGTTWKHSSRAPCGRNIYLEHWWSWSETSSLFWKKGVVLVRDLFPLLEKKGRGDHVHRHHPSSNKRKCQHGHRHPLPSSGSKGGVAIVIDTFPLLEKGVVLVRDLFPLLEKGEG